jgi:phosphoribosylanthranilate isomerase
LNRKTEADKQKACIARDEAGKGQCMIVQIYEIQTPREAEKCMEGGVDHLGSVVLSETKWRDPLLRETVRLLQNGGKKSSLIPLFTRKETIYRTLDYYGPDFVHFCDNLVSPEKQVHDLKPFKELQKGVKGYFPEIRIVRSIPLPCEEGDGKFPFLDIARELESLTDVFLTDTWVEEEPVTGFIGITGETVDWGMARKLVEEIRIPVILAGGLSPENVGEAILKILPAGADSCTLTNEKGPDGKPLRFRKDARKVREFVREVRMAEETLKEGLEKKLKDLKERLRDREAALPAHSVRPNQILVIEELEDRIEEVEKQIKRLEGTQLD